MTVVYSYRKAEENERADLYQLYRRVMKGYIEQIWEWDQQWQESEFSRHFEPKNITVVSTGGKLIGYADVESKKEELYIRMLVIAPEHRRKGIGTRLLRQILGSAASRSLGVKLQVFKANRTAKRFYENHGFRVTGETPTSLVMEYDA